MSDPAVRARHLKQTLAAAERSAAVAAAVRRLVPAPVLEAIEGAHGCDWLPVGHDVALVRVVHGALGVEAYDGFARGVVLDALKGPLLGPMARLVQAAFGLDAAAWARLVPRAWALVYRECGAWEVQRTGPTEVQLRIAGLAPACLDEPMWPPSLASSLSAVLAATGVEGTSTLERLDRASASLTYALRWRRRGA